MKILLDFDGVMVTTPTWRPVPQLEDGFMDFNSDCSHNLADLLTVTRADIVLTTTHRIHYSNDIWIEILANRGIKTTQVSKINDASSIVELGSRCEEIVEWIKRNPTEKFVIIDDDKSLRNLPNDLKVKWVETSFYEGFTIERKNKALDILLSNIH